MAKMNLDALIARARRGSRAEARGFHRIEAPYAWMRLKPDVRASAFRCYRQGPWLLFFSIYGSAVWGRVIAHLLHDDLGTPVFSHRIGPESMYDDVRAVQTESLEPLARDLLGSLEAAGADHLSGTDLDQVVVGIFDRWARGTRIPRLIRL